MSRGFHHIEITTPPIGGAIGDIIRYTNAWVNAGDIDGSGFDIIYDFSATSGSTTVTPVLTSGLPLYQSMSRPGAWAQPSL